MTVKDHDDEDCWQGLTRLMCTETIYLCAVTSVSTNSTLVVLGTRGWGGGMNSSSQVLRPTKTGLKRSSATSRMMDVQVVRTLPV